MRSPPTDAANLRPEKIFFLIMTMIYVYRAIRMLPVLNFNMYDLPVHPADPHAFFGHHGGNIYGAEADKIYKGYREYFAGEIKRRALSLRHSLKWTRRLTIALIFLILIDTLTRAWVYVPAPIAAKLIAFAQSWLPFLR